jgi:hypothetical protein
LHARCVHCRQTVIDGCKVVATIEVRRLREHLLGCPSAIAALAPALPVTTTRDELLKHFVVEELRQR